MKGDKSLVKLAGKPLNLSAGEHTRAVSVSGPGNFSSMKSFAPRKGANTHGNYIVEGTKYSM